MIRRLLVAAAVALGAITLLGGTAQAATPIACTYNVNPLNVGVCVSI